jgi:hypothetical protein
MNGTAHRRASPIGARYDGKQWILMRGRPLRGGSKYLLKSRPICNMISGTNAARQTIAIKTGAGVRVVGE